VPSTFDRHSPYGVLLRGPERPMAFVHPYRTIGELNQVERWKLDRHPLQVADDVISTYAKGGPQSISAVEGETERLKWVGIYPQRQGGDAFMLRVKVPGGLLSAAQAREIGVVAEAFGEGPDDSAVFGNRYADLTTRQDVQLHWIRIGDVPRIWKRLAEVGLTTIQACGDSARNVLCCPVSGVDADEVFDALPAALAITEFFTGNREYANLPRKFKMSVTGCREDCAQAEIQDIGMWPARAADGDVGFNVLVGGGLGDGERLASDIDVFVLPGDAQEVARAIAQVFGELGNRENRGMARLRYLAQELGPEGLRAELAARTRLELRPAGEELTRRYRGDHVGVHPQRQPGLHYVGCSVPVGRMSGIDLVEAARLASTYGDGTLRLGTDQNFVLTGVPEDRLGDLLAEPLLSKFSPRPGPFERGVVACTGNEFCRFAVVETKERAVTWARKLDAALAGAGHPGTGGGNGGTGGGNGGTGGGNESPPADDGIIRMHFSGCPASCAQPQIADVGFRGDTAHVDEHIVEAVDIGFGGSLGPDAGFIDWVENARPVEDVPRALLRVIERYRDERRPGEAFYQWARRTPNEELRATLAGLAVDDAGSDGGGR
jgi:ferredoxin-nitrite reductase